MKKFEAILNGRGTKLPIKRVTIKAASKKAALIAIGKRFPILYVAEIQEIKEK